MRFVRKTFLRYVMMGTVCHVMFDTAVMGSNPSLFQKTYEQENEDRERKTAPSTVSTYSMSSLLEPNLREINGLKLAADIQNAANQMKSFFEGARNNVIDHRMGSYEFTLHSALRANQIQSINDYVAQKTIPGLPTSCVLGEDLISKIQFMCAPLTMCSAPLDSKTKEIIGKILRNLASHLPLLRDKDIADLQRGLLRSDAVSPHNQSFSARQAVDQILKDFFKNLVSENNNMKYFLNVFDYIEQMPTLTMETNDQTWEALLDLLKNNPSDIGFSGGFLAHLLGQFFAKLPHDENFFRVHRERISKIMENIFIFIVKNKNLIEKEGLKNAIIITDFQISPSHLLDHQIFLNLLDAMPKHDIFFDILVNTADYEIFIALLKGHMFFEKDNKKNSFNNSEKMQNIYKKILYRRNVINMKKIKEYLDDHDMKIDVKTMEDYIHTSIGATFDTLITIVNNPLIPMNILNAQFNHQRKIVLDLLKRNRELGTVYGEGLVSAEHIFEKILFTRFLNTMLIIKKSNFDENIKSKMINNTEKIFKECVGLLPLLQGGTNKLYVGYSLIKSIIENDLMVDYIKTLTNQLDPIIDQSNRQIEEERARLKNIKEKEERRKEQELKEEEAKKREEAKRELERERARRNEEERQRTETILAEQRKAEDARKQKEKEELEQIRQEREAAAEAERQRKIREANERAKAKHAKQAEEKRKKAEALRLKQEAEKKRRAEEEERARKTKEEIERKKKEQEDEAHKTKKRQEQEKEDLIRAKAQAANAKAAAAPVGLPHPTEESDFWADPDFPLPGMVPAPVEGQALEETNLIYTQNAGPLASSGGNAAYQAHKTSPWKQPITLAQMITAKLGGPPLSSATKERPAASPKRPVPASAVLPSASAITTKGQGSLVDSRNASLNQGIPSRSRGVLYRHRRGASQRSSFSKEEGSVESYAANKRGGHERGRGGRGKRGHRGGY